MRRMKSYIHQQTNWPDFSWDSSAILQKLGETRNLQGKILGKMESLGFEYKKEAELETLTLDIIKTSEIEGEYLNSDQVRSSIARRLGIEITGSVESDRDVDGIVDMMLDATQNYSKPLNAERLFDWHAAMFPSGRSGMYKIVVANWRNDFGGPMQVISGALGKEKIHFQAPDSTIVPLEMGKFIDWFNYENQLDLVLKAAIAHLWFVTIHPFDDGNGRITRALTDLLLARSDKSPQRFYSMSAQIRKQHKSYYEILEKTQKANLDITNWILWFLDCLINALHSTELISATVLKKADFWKTHSQTIFNERQRLMLNKLFEGFDGKLTSSKWAKITKCSNDTSLRDIQDLINRNILKKENSRGRSTNYELI